MRTEEEIKRNLSCMKVIVMAENKDTFTKGFDFGYFKALEWVLESEDKDDTSK